MNILKLEKNLNKILIICLYIAVSAPLWVTNAFYYPGMFTKTIIFCLAVQVALACYLILLKINREKYLPKGDYLIYWLSGFFALMFLSCFLGVNFEKSFWGNFERLNGFFTQIHYFIFFFLLVAILKNKEQWNKLLKFNLIIAYLVGLYGLAQKLELPIVYETGFGRLTSSLGNPLFLGSYLLIQTFINIKVLFSLWQEAGGRWTKVLYSAGLALTVYILILTKVRGVFLGFAVGIFLLFIGALFIWRKQKKTKTYLSLAIILSVIILGGAVLFRNSDLVRDTGVSRLVNYSIKGSTIQTRLTAWQGGLEAIRDNWLVGVGWENYYAVFNKYFDPIFYTLIFQETYWDRAHNNYLNIINELGVLGLLLYLAVFFMAVKRLWQSLKNAEDKKAKAGYWTLIVLLIAYFIENAFAFDTASSYIVIFLVLAFAALEKQSARNNGLDNQAEKYNKNIVYIVIIVSLILGLVIYEIDYNKYIKSNLAIIGVMGTGENYGADLKGGMEQYKNALNKTTIDKRDIRIRLGLYTSDFIAMAAEDQETINNSFAYTLSEVEKEISKNHKDALFMVMAANFYNACGEYNKNKDVNTAVGCLNRAEELLNQAIELSRNRQQTYLSLGNTYLIRGDYDKALDIFKKAISYNSKFPDLYWFISLTYFSKNDVANGIIFAEKALDLNYEFRTEQEINYLAQAYAKSGDFNKLLDLYLKLTGKFFDSGPAFAKLAAVYAQIGDMENARKAVAKAVSLEPSLAAEAEVFLKMITNN
ncbi:MAG: O-antigen ligase family protein [Patescibacteria group bacterium]|nr:O-antigen ligase family protein [Patescibacteria group bacterium]